MAKAHDPRYDEEHAIVGTRNGLDLLGGGEILQKGAMLDGEGRYQVFNPYRLYRGKSYSDWTADWFNWFLSADADKRNFGPIVFLRSRGLPDRVSGAYISKVPGQDINETSMSDPHTNDMEYRSEYINDPNIRIGSDRLQIFEDQLVFVPIINAYEFASIRPQIDWGWMQDFTGLTIDYGDNPPEPNQLTINNRQVILPDTLEMSDFRINTPIFPAIVPDVQYGRSLKDFLEDGPIQPGMYPAMVEGYFMMLAFWPGVYWLHAWASAPREKSGPYFSELLYQIEVRQRQPATQRGALTAGLLPNRNPQNGFTFPSVNSRQSKTTIVRPSRNESLFNKTYYRKTEVGELTQPEIKRFSTYFSNTLSPNRRGSNGAGGGGRTKKRSP